MVEASCETFMKGDMVAHVETGRVGRVQSTRGEGGIYVRFGGIWLDIVPVEKLRDATASEVAAFEALKRQA